MRNAMRSGTVLFVFFLISCAPPEHRQRVSPRQLAADYQQKRKAFGLASPDMRQSHFNLERRRTLDLNFERSLLASNEVLAACRVETPGVFNVYVTSTSFEDFRDIPLLHPHTIEKEFRALSAKMGMSTSCSASQTCYAGTLGISAFDLKNTKITGYITNKHVAAALGSALCPKASTATEFSPASGDRRSPCTPGSEIGRLCHAAPLDLSESAANHVDAAFVASSGMGVSVENACGICLPSGTAAIVAPTIGLPVQTCARSGVAKPLSGTVTGFDCAVKVRYDPCVEGFVGFVGQIRVSGPFSKRGDSGAAVYGKGGGVIGLLFAGDEVDTTFVNPMQDVVNELKVGLVPPVCQ